MYNGLYSERFGFPIYTLRILTGQIYVINDAHLAATVQRRTDAFSFDPFVLMAAERLAGTTPEGMKLVRQGIASSHPKQGVVFDTQDRFHKLLNLNTNLAIMSQEMFRNTAAALHTLDHSGDTVIDLSSWTKEVISIASTNTIYGPMNPFAKNSQVYRAFW